MTSEYNDGPELFDNDSFSQGNSSVPIKNEKKVVVRKTTDNSSSAKRKKSKIC